jgi:predicted amino acid racemase
MSTPRLEVDLGKVRHNTRFLVDRLKVRGIDVTGVTKGVCGNPAIAQAMLDGGAVGLAEARISNVVRLRQAGIRCPITMIRTPLLSQVDEIIKDCDVSYNSEVSIIDALGAAAVRAGTIHNIVLMVEMGDMREGILPEDLIEIADKVHQVRGINIMGIAANFACLNGTPADFSTMQAFSNLAIDTEAMCDLVLDSVSGGNSTNIAWALGPWSTGRVNDLRLGESILLGRDPILGKQIAGLHTDAFTFVTEVIESKHKAAKSMLSRVDAKLNFLRVVPLHSDHGRSILAMGLQDTDVDGLTFPAGTTSLGSTSDHTVVQTTLSSLSAGDELRFGVNYNALMRIMAAPDTTLVYVAETELFGSDTIKRDGPFLELI